MSALAPKPLWAAAHNARPSQKQRERRHLRVLSPATERYAYEQVLESWERALAASERALDSAVAVGTYAGPDLSTRRRLRAEERRWFARLKQIGSYDPLPRLTLDPQNPHGESAPAPMRLTKRDATIWRASAKRRTGPSGRKGEREMSFDSEEARRIGEQIAIDWATAPFDVEQFRIGMNVELEHGLHDPATNVTGDDPVVTGKIALAHLNEFPDYYTRLERMEEEAKRDHGLA
jgi:Protein of unknown function (DUF5661)